MDDTSRERVKPINRKTMVTEDIFNPAEFNISETKLECSVSKLNSNE